MEKIILGNKVFIFNLSELNYRREIYFSDMSEVLEEKYDNISQLLATKALVYSIILN